MTEEKKRAVKTMTEKEQKNKKVVKPEKVKSGSGFSIFFSLFLFIIVGAVLGCGYYFYAPKINNLNRLVATNQSKIQDISNANQQQFLANKVNELSRMVSQLQQTNKQYQQNTAQQLAKVKQKVFLNQQSWLYADIHYLLKLAVRRVNLVGDSKGAIKALEVADSEIRKVENTALLEIRKTIFETIKNLRTVQEPDTEGLLVKVDYIKTILLTDESEQKKSFFVVKSESSKQPNAKGEVSFDGSFKEFISQFFSVKESKTKPVTKVKKPNLNREMSDQLKTLILIEKLRRAILTMDQEKFDYYNQKLHLSSLPQKVKTELDNLKNHVVGISIPSASQPLLRYELVLKKMQEDSLHNTPKGEEK